MNRTRSGGYPAQVNAGMGLLGEGPGYGGQGQMEPMSLGMQRMTGDDGWNSVGAGRGRMSGASMGQQSKGLLGNIPQSQQQPRSLMEDTESGYRDRQTYRADSHGESRGRFNTDQDMRGYPRDDTGNRGGLMEQPAGRRSRFDEPEPRRSSLEQPRAGSGYYDMEQSQEPQQQRGILREPQQQRSILRDPQQQRGILRESQQQRGILDEPQQQRGILREPQQQRGILRESQQQRGILNEPQQQRGILREPQQQRGLLREPQQQRGLLREPQQQRGILDEPQQQRSILREPQQQRSILREPQQQRGILREPQQQRGITREPQQQRGILDEPQQQRGILREPQQQRGILNEPQQQRGILNEPQQQRGILNEPQQQRGLLNEPQQQRRPIKQERGFIQEQHEMQRGRMEDLAGYSNQSQSQRLPEETGFQRRYPDDNNTGGGLMEPPPMPAGALLNVGQGAGREEQAGRRGLLGLPGRPGGGVRGRDQQMELMEKAEMQMRMIQEEERQKDEILKREMVEIERRRQMEAAARQQQQQLMMQAQLQQQQQQQQRQQRSPNNGLLGSGPGAMPGRGRPRGEIPSLFEVQGRKPGLGKRQGGSPGVRPGEGKRPRQALGNDRDRPSRWEQDRPSRRDGSDQRRGRDGDDSRRSSKSRDRKDSDAKKSIEKPAKPTDKSTKPTDKSTKPTDKSTKPADKSPRKGQVTPKDPKVNDAKVKGDKVKEEEGAAGKNGKKDAEGNTTQVTVTMGEEYDPAEPTGDATEDVAMEFDTDTTEVDTKVAEKTSAVTETDAPKPATTDAAPKLQQKDSVTEEKGDKPMEISLTVTVSKKGRSVNDTDKDGEEKPKREKRYKCNVCSVDCYDEESFSRHMNGVKHRKKMEVVMTSSTQGAVLLSARKQAEQHLRQIEARRKGGAGAGAGASSPQGKPLPPGKALETHCKVCDKKFTGAFKDHKDDPEHKAREDRRKAGCKICKVESFNSYIDFTKHLQSKWHAKKSWPECKLCDQRFKSPRKFVQHCRTDHHIKNREKNKSETDGDHDEMEELVILDTIGFEEDPADMDTSDPKSRSPDKKKTLESAKTSETQVLTSTPKPVSGLKMTQPGASPIVETKPEVSEKVPKQFDPEVAVGQQFVVAVTGYFCKLCHKFYNNETSARVIHCQTQSHYEKFKKYMVAKTSQRKQKEDTPSPSGKEQPPANDPKLDSNDNTDDNDKDDKADNDDKDNNADNDKADSPEKATDMKVNGTAKPEDIEEESNSSQKDQSEMEASAYETADEHKDSTINITISLDSEATGADEESNVEEGVKGVEEEEVKEVPGAKKGPAASSQKARRGRQTARRGRRN